MRWDGLICLVTGASSGFGRAIARAIARKGGTVLAVARRQERLQSLIEELGGPPHSYIACDVSDLQEVRRMAASAAERVPHLDVLVNNAGIPSGGRFLQASGEAIERVIRTNLLGPIWCTRELSGLLESAPRRSRSPVVVNLASMAGRIASPDAADYTAAKFGLVGFTEAVWAELAAAGIRVMMVNPGLSRTEGFPMDQVLKDPLGKRLVMRPRRVADALLRGVEKGSFEVRVQWWMHPLYIGSVLIGPFRRIVAGRVRRSIGNVGAGGGQK